MKENQLGKKVQYKEIYDNSVLFPINRKGTRNFNGYDIWNCYEFSYLNKKGKPIIRKLKLIYDAHSDYIIESKSLKLYLNSFIMTRFQDDIEVLNIIKNDLTSVLKTNVNVFFENFYDKKIYKMPKKFLIDNLDISIDNYSIQDNLLKTIDNNIKLKSVHYSELLKSNCPITNQPDWGTIYIEYKSKKKLDNESLLKYIVSFRQHNDFHEQCCEKMYLDIFNIINPDYLIVSTYYTRRGGIDINPIRFSPNKDYNYKIFDKYYSRQ